MSIRAVSPGDEQELSPRSALLTQCVFLSLQPQEDFARQEFAVHIRKLSRNSHLHTAAALWDGGAVGSDRAGSVEMLCGPFLAPSRAAVPGVSSTGTQIWCPAAEAQGQPGKRQELELPSPKAWKGGRCWGGSTRNRQGQGSSHGHH